jgi:hypothetical protein
MRADNGQQPFASRPLAPICVGSTTSPGRLIRDTPSVRAEVNDIKAEAAAMRKEHGQMLREILDRLS